MKVRRKTLEEGRQKVKRTLAFFWGIVVLGIFFGSLHAMMMTGPVYALQFWQQDWEDASSSFNDGQEGWISWYGRGFHGRRTASGESFDKNADTCASRTLAFGTWVKITHSQTGLSALCRVNDRGPHSKRRILDVSHSVAQRLGLLRTGVAWVSLQILE